MADKDIIVFNFQELMSISNNMSVITSVLENVRNTTDSLKTSSSDFWQGEAHEAFLKRVTDMETSLQKLYDQVDKSRKKLDTAIQLETQNEDSLTQKTVGGLSAEEIF